MAVVARAVGWLASVAMTRVSGSERLERAASEVNRDAIAVDHNVVDRQDDDAAASGFAFRDERGDQPAARRP
jgi:hypothetical protein